MSKEIIEGNKLIAEFMGITRGIDNYYNGMTDDKGSNEFPCWVYPDGKKFTHLYYHYSWDWLMPVVEKMCKIKCMWDNVEPHELDTYYPRTFGMLNAETKRPMVRINSNPLFEADTLIGATWLAVINFITWYNQQNT